MDLTGLYIFILDQSKNVEDQNVISSKHKEIKEDNYLKNLI